MTKLKQDDMKAITTELASPWGCVGLVCDGYRVTVAVVRTGALRFGLTVYINGRQTGKQLVEDCEERRRFLRPCEQYLYSPAERKNLVKIGGKRFAKQMGAEKRFTFYSHNWLSVRTMLRHFTANNASVELVEIGASAVRASLPRDEAVTDA